MTTTNSPDLALAALVLDTDGRVLDLIHDFGLSAALRAAGHVDTAEAIDSASGDAAELVHVETVLINLGLTATAADVRMHRELAEAERDHHWDDAEFFAKAAARRLIAEVGLARAVDIVHGEHSRLAA